MQPILVTGGTGTLGRLVVARLREAGRTVRVLSRRGRENGESVEFVRGDLDTGEGIAAAVEGAEIIVHCAGSSKGDEDKALTLVRAASRAGARHLLNISVVGAERIPVVSGVDRAMLGYFASKLDAERAVVSRQSSVALRHQNAVYIQIAGSTSLTNAVDKYPYRGRRRPRSAPARREDTRRSARG
jgi:uncharacterized protein YbjT (DUF2867 family)